MSRERGKGGDVEEKHSSREASVVLCLLGPHFFKLARSPLLFGNRAATLIDGVLYTPRVCAAAALLLLLQQRQASRGSSSTDSSDAARSQRQRQQKPEATNSTMLSRRRRFEFFFFALVLLLPAPLHAGYQARCERALRGHADGT